MPTLPVPRVGKGPRIRAWFGYLIFVVVFGFFAFGVLVNLDVFDSGVPSEYALVVAALFVLAMPLFLRRFSRRGLFGIVTQLRQDYRTSDKKTKIVWAFDLQPCGKSWDPLRDRRGFIVPRVEVTFDVSSVHGEQLEEGSRVAVVGRKKQRAVSAKEIWNLTSRTMAESGPQWKRMFGRVTDLQATDHVRDTRYVDGRALLVRNFRIQPTDPQLIDSVRDQAGNLVPAVPVEIRAREITGLIQEGDKLEVVGYLVAGTMHTKEVYNHSAGGAPLVVKEWVGPA